MVGVTRLMLTEETEAFREGFLGPLADGAVRVRCGTAMGVLDMANAMLDAAMAVARPVGLRLGVDPRRHVFFLVFDGGTGAEDGLGLITERMEAASESGTRDVGSVVALGMVESLRGF